MKLPNTFAGMTNSMSYWEYKTYFQGVDFCIVGMGIVGCHTALMLRQKYPTAKIVVIDGHSFGASASSRNAGFACFGSVSEIADDVRSSGFEAAINLVHERYQGLQLLRSIHGDDKLGYKQTGGFELFTTQDEERWSMSTDLVPELNRALKSLAPEVYRISPNNKQVFKQPVKIIENSEEGEIQTDLLYFSMLSALHHNRVFMLRGVRITDFMNENEGVKVSTSVGDFTCRKLILATNGLTSKLLPHLDVAPARAQVLVTSPLSKVNLTGCFHYDAGYYYFRMIDNRLLIGGARNTDFEGEQTASLENTNAILAHIQSLAETLIINEPYQIEHTWAGTMGVGQARHPLVDHYASNIIYGVRMGGMGVALGCLVSKKIADLL
ncbi:MAG TPA: FAD-dependent oxidoreductase [Luteibaculaceae bacterium]|nr:FAD-dependent oxidoreductase [Luteibaculaceae bacterium]